jgi:hypothetical protein
MAPKVSDLRQIKKRLSVGWTFCGKMSLNGTKRTWRSRLAISAFGVKRTCGTSCPRTVFFWTSGDGAELRPSSLSAKRRHHRILRAWVCAGCSILNTFTVQF